jgi:UDP-N-acetylglucosamine diphosphorylase / glucose-1-phosphate thymidylyltransferase / UDP-N-acetylgalactosamine diphosphorylase / glucosamine-1-phosphate N-acetyltransferase / galactosamine-1-phosphate N-acetyltransferase
MNKIIFTEEFCQPENLHPFTLTRQLQDIRVGILTIREKWERMLELPSFDKKENDYKDLQRSVYIDEAVGDGFCLMIHGNVLPTPKLVKAIGQLKDGEFIATKTGTGIAFRFTRNEIEDRHKIKVGKAIPFKQAIKTIQFPWDIFQLNDWAIREDFDLLTRKKRSQPVSKTNKVTNAPQVFLEKGVRMEHCIINASTGPVYIGRDAEVMEGSIPALRGGR